MSRSKTIDIILSFSPEELKAMSLFIKSPYFNTNKNLVKLFGALRKELPLIKTGRISEEDIFRKVFPGKKFNYGIMKNLTSSLFSLLEEFLLFNTLKNTSEKKFDNAITLARQYDTRFLDSFFYRVMKKQREELKSGKIYPELYRDLAELEEQEYFFHSSRTDDISLQNAVYNEVIYSIADMTRKFSRSLWKMQIIEGNVNSKYEVDLKKIIAENINFEGMTESLSGTDERTYANIKINSLLIKLLTDGSDVSYFKGIMELLNKYIEMYENYERFSILSKIISYCAVMYEEGRTEFLPESLVIQKLVLEKVHFRSEGLGPFNFHNFIEIAEKFIHEDQTPEAEAMVKNNLNIIEDDKQELASRLIMASVYIERGEFEQAIEEIKRIKPHDTFVKMFVRKIYIKAYYELGSYEQGLDIIASFNKFVREKNELDEYSKNTHVHSLKIFEKLYKMKCSPDKYTLDDVTVLEKEVAENNYVNKKWQLKKAKALKSIIK